MTMKVDGMVDQAISQAQGQMKARAERTSTSAFGSDAEMRKAAKQFEEMFTNLVVKQMRETVPDSEVFGDSSKVKFFQSMLDEEYSKMSSEHSKNSLSELIYQNLKRQAGAVAPVQEVTKAAIKPSDESNTPREGITNEDQR